MRIRLTEQSTWYPPSRYFFMPVYRKLRRRLGCKYKAFTSLMLISGLLHVLGFSLFGKFATAAFCAVVYSLLASIAWFNPARQRHNCLVAARRRLRQREKESTYESA